MMLDSKRESVEPEGDPVEPAEPVADAPKIEPEDGFEDKMEDIPF